MEIWHHFLSELYNAVLNRVEGIVLPLAYTDAWAILCPALFDDDLPSFYHLSIRLFEAESFRDGISTITSGSLGFFMRHRVGFLDQIIPGDLTIMG